MDFQYYLEQLRQNLDLGSERSHYYALKSLVDSALIGINTVVEEKGNQAGIPDFTVRRNERVIGYIEAKKLGTDLNQVQESEQLKRYLDSAIGQNLILTNFLEFRLFRDGKLYLYGSLGTLENEKIVLYRDFERATNLISEFVNYQEKSVNNYLDLAEKMAIYTKSAKYAIEEALKIEDETGELTQLKTTFTDLLLPDLDNQEFADMYAQTLAYGLFTARFYHAQNSPWNSLTTASPLTKRKEKEIPFNRQNISLYLSDQIPFLEGLFKTVIKTDIVSKIDWAIDNLIELFAEIDMINILENFGQEIGRDDPVIHFYETFLGAYSADLRKSRGVYYTPPAVVDFMVKAVNDLVDKEFDVDGGLANRRVTILDPATGTGTFLYQVIKQICENHSSYSSNKWQHDWQKYFTDKRVLSRLFGFELLMTPYTIAHLKLQLLLKNLGYHLGKKEKLNIFLTNALEEGIKKSEYFLSEYIVKEANESAKVKKETPILVVLGNPPYSGHSTNKNSWIDKFVRDYYEVDGLPLKEKNSKWLQDDYVKFIRFAQWKIERQGEGILAFITNHGYLDNPTFRGMRQNLRECFERIYIINLHGNVKKKEICPDGSKDENVFDIQQGVSILLAIKGPLARCASIGVNAFDPKSIKKGIFYYDLWGKREDKYKFLHETNFYDMEWHKVQPISPFYLFIPQDDLLREEYDTFWKITDIMPVNSVGIVTARDSLTIQNSPEDIVNIVNDFISLSEEEAREKYNLSKDSQDWKVSLAQKDIKETQVKNKINQDLITPILYRPFDLKYTYYTSKSGGFICRPRGEVMRNMLLGDNLALITVRQQSQPDEWALVGVTQNMIESCVISNKTREINYLFPLYIYPNTENGQNNLSETKEPNFSPEFLRAITEKLGYTPTPENIFYYIYAVFHSPYYRDRYAEFLKIDFPRIPLPNNDEYFNQLVSKGETLVNLHLMKQLPNHITITKNETPTTVNLPLFNEETRGTIHYQGDGTNEIERINYSSAKQRITINLNCYFVGIPEEVWEFKIGGYQVLNKWLKDRKKAKRNLSTEDITHYQKIIVVLSETIKIMTEIDLITICRLGGGNETQQN